MEFWRKDKAAFGCGRIQGFRRAESGALGLGFCVRVGTRILADLAMVEVRDLEFDFDVVALDSDFIADDVSRRRSTPHGSVCDVEDGAVPRAGHFCALKHSLGEGPASVGTGLVNGIERPVDVEERYFLRGGIHELALTRSDYAGCGDLDELAHRVPPGAHDTPVLFRARRDEGSETLARCFCS